MILSLRKAPPASKFKKFNSFIFLFLLCYSHILFTMFSKATHPHTLIRPPSRFASITKTKDTPQGCLGILNPANGRLQRVENTWLAHSSIAKKRKKRERGKKGLSISIDLEGCPDEVRIRGRGETDEEPARGCSSR